MQITIEIPNNCVPERKYAIDCLLRYFEGVSWSYREINENQTHFIFQEKRFLSIQDDFWKDLVAEDFDYKKLSIPKTSSEVVISCPLYNGIIASVFGVNKFNYTNNCLTLQTDLIASTFFLLTRWEEYALPDKDMYNRFPDEASFLFKNKLTHRPLVNEYIEFLKDVFYNISGEEINYNRKYCAHITHDIDEIYRFSPLTKFFKALGGDLIIRKSIKQFFQTTRQKIRILFGSEKDPSDTFDYLMRTSEKFQLKSSFYFIPGEKKEKDFRYSISNPTVKNIIHDILERGHIVGIHPSLETNGNAKHFERELKRLTSVSGLRPKSGRHHYLAFQVPFTWRFWNENNLRTDSSMGYRTCAGFRSGICYVHPVFDILDRKQLKIEELPLTLMEVALAHAKVSPEKFETITEELAKTVKKYQGDFVLLWHNNNINHPYYKKYGKLYEKIISTIAHY